MIIKTKIKPLEVPHVARHGEVACDLRRLEGFFYSMGKEVMRGLDKQTHGIGSRQCQKGLLSPCPWVNLA